MSEPQTKDRTIYIRITQEQHERLKALAELDQRDISFLSRTAIEQYINRRKAA